jgi:hypothetical protein
VSGVKDKSRRSLIASALLYPIASSCPSFHELAAARSFLLVAESLVIAYWIHSKGRLFDSSQQSVLTIELAQ